jgi:hypothetical protein
MRAGHVQPQPAVIAEPFPQPVFEQDSGGFRPGFEVGGELFRNVSCAGACGA